MRQKNKLKTNSVMIPHQVRQKAASPLISLLLFLPMAANSLELGQISLNSRLGQNMQAEIALGSLGGVSVEQLKPKIGNAEAYKRLGLEYTPVIQALQIEVQKRSNDSAVLLLKGDMPLRDPYLDLIIELTWPAGQLTKDYILLLDTQLKQTTSNNLLATPQAPLAANVLTPVQIAPTAISMPANIRAETKAASVGGKKINPSDKTVTVRYGDTAAAIAKQYQPTGVSLEQMLVAMLRLNAHAFVRDNVNRLRADVSLDIPAAESVGNISNAEASQQISAQAKNFADYRRQLAQQNSAGIAGDKRSRQVGGKLGGGVLNVKPLSAGPADQLKLSKQLPPSLDAKVQAKITGKAEAEEKLARLSALSQNLQQIKGLADTSSVKGKEKSDVAALPGEQNNSKAKVETSNQLGLTLPASDLAAISTKDVAVASNPQVETTSATIKSRVDVAGDGGQSKPQPAKSEIPLLPEENSLDWVLATLIGLCVMAFGGFIYRFRQHKAKSKKSGDSIFAPTRQETDVFFNVAGGHEVDISAEAKKTLSTTDRNDHEQSGVSHEPGKMEVDPIAEAEVYLAYGREQQAEEILSEARQKDPKNPAVLLKLAEIYVLRTNRQAFDKIAKELQQNSGGQGESWEKILLLGQKLSPNNPLYQVKPPLVSLPQVPDINNVTEHQFRDDTIPKIVQAKQLALDSQTKTAETSGSATSMAADQPELSLPTLKQLPDMAGASTKVQSTPSQLPEKLLNTQLGGDMVMSPALQMVARVPELSKQNVATPIKKITTRNYDPQQIKLDLAKEFMSSNDFEGAKELIDEVAADGSPELRQRALQMRNELPKPPNSEQPA
jgi:pilus assembly protein FimV